MKAYQRIQALDWDDAQDYLVHTDAVIAAEQGVPAGHGPDLFTASHRASEQGI